MTEKLLPCPFCGGEATVGANEYYDGANTFYTHCTGCGAQLPTKTRTDEAIAAWNRRAQPDNEPLTCEGCIYFNDDYEYPPCHECKRLIRANDCYRSKPERSEG